MRQHLALFTCLAAGASALTGGNASLALPSLPVTLDKEQLLMEVERAPKWLQQSLRSMVPSAGSMSTGTHPRALMDEGLCTAFAAWIVPLSIFLSALPHLGMMMTDKATMCPLQKAHGNMNMDGTEKRVCPSKVAADCYDGCQWSTDTNSCADFSWFPMLIDLTKPEVGSPAKMMMDQVLVCSKLAKAACTGDCMYNEKDSKCDVGAAYNKKYACDHASSETLMTLGCDKKSKGACTGDCAWKPMENKCDIAPALFYELFFGKTSGATLTENVVKMEICATDKACTTAGCGRDFAGTCGIAMDGSMKDAVEKCGTPEIKAAMKTGTEAAKAACTGDCAFSMNENNCNPSPATIGDICGWPKPGDPAAAVSVALRLQLSLLSAVLLATCTSLMWG